MGSGKHKRDDTPYRSYVPWLAGGVIAAMAATKPNSSKLNDRPWLASLIAKFPKAST